MSSPHSALPWALALAICLGCSEDGTSAPVDPDSTPRETRDGATTRTLWDAGIEGEWEAVFQELGGALISVSGTSDRDVWVAGSLDAATGGPMVLHYDGDLWTRHVFEAAIDLWWVHAASPDNVFFGGTDGAILTFDGTSFTRAETPSADGTVYGIWAAASDDVWAVGGDPSGGNGSFVWRFEGQRWQTVSVPARDDTTSFFKVWGASADDVWLVGSDGTVIHYDGASFSAIDTGAAEPLFTVHAEAGAESAFAVGGFDAAVAFELGRANADPVSLPRGTVQLFGVWADGSSVTAVGAYTTIVRGDEDGWSEVDTGLDLFEGLHAVWLDSTGAIWAVGGDVMAPPLGRGLLLHYGKSISSEIVSIDTRLDGP